MRHAFSIDDANIDGRIDLADCHQHVRLVLGDERADAGRADDAIDGALIVVLSRSMRAVFRLALADSTSAFAYQSAAA